MIYLAKSAIYFLKMNKTSSRLCLILLPILLKMYEVYMRSDSLSANSEVLSGLKRPQQSAFRLGV